MIPKYVFFVSGIGEGERELIAYEMALRDCGVPHQNFVAVSSIVPPKCKLISEKKGIKLLQPGGITFCVESKMFLPPGSSGAVSVAMARTGVKNSFSDRFGYIYEHHGTTKRCSDLDNFFDYIFTTCKEGANLLLSEYVEGCKIDIDGTSKSGSSSNKKCVRTCLLAMAVFIC